MYRVQKVWLDLCRRRCLIGRGSVQDGTDAAAASHQGPYVHCTGSLAPAAVTTVREFNRNTTYPRHRAAGYFLQCFRAVVWCSCSCSSKYRCSTWLSKGERMSCAKYRTRNPQRLSLEQLCGQGPGLTWKIKQKPNVVVVVVVVTCMKFSKSCVLGSVVVHRSVSRIFLL